MFVDYFLIIAASTSSVAVSTLTPLIIQIPVANNDMVKEAFRMLSNRRVSKSEEHFIISTKTVDHADIKEYSKLICEQHKTTDIEVKDYLRRIHLTKKRNTNSKSYYCWYTK
jgi:hypothetical protein